MTTSADKSLESWIWDAACSIRGAQEAPKFKDFILPLIFTKRLCDVFDDELNRIAVEVGSRAKAFKLVAKDHKLVRFYLPLKPADPDESVWSVVRKLTGKIGESLTTHLHDIAKANPALEGIIDRMDFNATTHGQRDIDDDRLSNLIERVSEKRLGLKDVEADIIGRSYEYLIRKFAEGSGQSAGEFFTPPEVARIMARIMDPDPGLSVYDPCCGSAGLLIACEHVLDEKMGARSASKGKKYGPLKMHGQEYVSEAELRELGGRAFDARTIVFPKVGATIFTNKKRILARTAVVDNNVMGVTVHDANTCWPEFLFFWFQNIDLKTLSSPGTVPSITSTRVKAQSVMLPPPDEQRRIAAALSAVQRAIERQERLIALTAELKKALMHKLFTEGTRGEPLKQTEIGPVPASWRENRLGTIARFSSGGTPSREVGDYWVGGTIPWVKTTEIDYCVINATGERITQAGLDSSSAKIFPAGTLLVAMYGQGVTRGRAGILGIDAATNQACAAITPHSENEISTRFLYYFLEFHYEHLRQRGHGANQSNLSMTLLKQFPAYYPKRAAQDTIVSVLRALDDKAAIHERERAAQTSLFRTLLHQLMTAQVRVHDLDLSALEEAGQPAGAPTDNGAPLDPS